MKTGNLLKLIFTVTAFFFLLFNYSNAQSNLPPGFVDNVISTGWTGVEGFRFDKNGQMYVWEKRGRVYVVDTNGVKHSPPLINITDEVGNFGDNGLNGFCLDPDFLNNGYLYLYYTVDRHHLFYFGTPQYDPNANEYYNATICRVTRYQADKLTNFTTLVAGSRFILIGEDKKSGVPVLYPAHTGGTIMFGNDSSLIVSTSDGASYGDLDTGSVPSTYWAQALADTIIPAGHNVGAFRSQLKNSMNGKILRIDKMTGNGLNSNPFFDSTDVRSARSRTYASGFRNPFRITIIPNTGSTDITAGNPGVMMVGDVGWNTWEELDVIKSGGGNYGWPVFEGLTKEPKYSIASIPDIETPNPLYGTGGCTQQYFYFWQIIKQPQSGSSPAFLNPCDSSQQLASGITTIHNRPDIEWRHNQNITRVPGFNGGNPVSILLSDSNSTVSGNMFQGNTSVGGEYYTGTNFPFNYYNTYFHCDYGQGWIRNFRLDSLYHLQSVAEFDTGGIGLGKIVFLQQHPSNGCLMYVAYSDTIREICFTGQVNYPPKAVAIADTIYGVSPLTVHFTGSNSTDPENHPLTYLWDFGDASPASSAADTQHVFTAPAGVPTTYNVTLTVTDDSNYTSVASLKIFLNNTPPSVQITSIPAGTMYSIIAQTNLTLQANVYDAESANNLLHYEWETDLYHNQHIHPGAIDTDSVSYAVLTPIGCNGETYFYRVNLRVYDPQGMMGYNYVDILPDCSSYADFTLASPDFLKIIAYPNPANDDNLRLKIFNPQTFKNNIIAIKIFSIDGREALSKTFTLPAGSKIADFDLKFENSLAKGMYFISAFNGKEQGFTKFIKN